MKKIVYLMMAAMICLTSCDKENDIDDSERINESIIAKLKQWQEAESYTRISEEYYNNEIIHTNTVIYKDGLGVEYLYTDSQGMITSKLTYEKSGNTAIETHYINPFLIDSTLIVYYRTTYEFASATSTMLLRESTDYYNFFGVLNCKEYTDYNYSDGRIALAETHRSYNGSDYFVTGKFVYTYKDDNNYELIIYNGDTIPESKMTVQGEELVSTINYYTYNYYNSVTGQQIPGWTLTSSYWNRWKDNNQMESLECIARELSSDGELVTLYHDVYTYDGYGLMTSCTTTNEHGTTVTTCFYERLGGVIVSEKTYIDDVLNYTRVVSVEGDNVVSYEYEYDNDLSEMALICKTTYIL